MPIPGTPQECQECGKSFPASRQGRRFCSTDCRMAFTRRRRDRGAELYDFVMAIEPAVVDRLIEAYRAADRAKRGGRPSWQPPDVAKMALPIVYGKEGDKR